MKKKISIIIPTRNRIKTLKQCLKKLDESKVEINEIFIIDQSEVPLNIELIKNELKNYENISIIHQKKPSLTVARNNGLKRANGDIIIFMDDDTIINNSTIEKVKSTFEKDEKIKLVTAVDINSKKKRKYPEILSLIFLRKKITFSGGYCCKGAMLGRYKECIEGIKNTEWAMGYFFAIDKQIINKYNLEFDENLISYAYPEDLDFTHNYCKLAKKDGGKCVINGDIYVNHLGSKEFRVESDKSLSMYVINRLYLSYKYFKSPIYRIILIWSDIGEVIRRILTKSEYKPIVKAYIECFKNRKNLKDKKINFELLELMR